MQVAGKKKKKKKKKDEKIVTGGKSDSLFLNHSGLNEKQMNTLRILQVHLYV